MFLDTSGLLSLRDRRDRSHEKAETLYRDASRPVTHSLILAEFIPLAQARGMPRREALTYVSDLIGNEDVAVHWLDERAFGAALSLLRRRPDKTYSLCDAASFLLMRRLGVTEALTTDRHFEQEGFVRLLKR